MRRFVTAAVSLTGAAAITLTATPASAAAPDWNSGLTFYAGTTATPVANVADPDGTCTPFPATATLLVGWSNVEQVLAYAGPGCTGAEVGLGTLRGFTAGQYLSYRAF